MGVSAFPAFERTVFEGLCGQPKRWQMVPKNPRGFTLHTRNFLLLSQFWANATLAGDWITTGLSWNTSTDKLVMICDGTSANQMANFSSTGWPH
jgi:hypothetical protein